MEMGCRLMPCLNLGINFTFQLPSPGPEYCGCSIMLEQIVGIQSCLKKDLKGRF